MNTNTSNPAAPSWFIGMSFVVLFVVTAAQTRGEDWQDDLQFASCDCDVADSGAEAEEVADDYCSVGCASACCTSAACDDGYCFTSPLSDELSRRMTAMAKSMESQGFIYAPGLTQFYQGAASGGREQEFAYGGKVDQFLILDSDKLGLWEGMTMTMHAETRFGEDVNLQAVGLAPVNVAMLYPKVNEHDTAITGLSFAQELTDEVQFAFGKFNTLDLWYGLYPQTGRGVNGFMNASTVLPLGGVARTVPLAVMGAGVMKYEGKQIQSGVVVFDPKNVATTSGFDDLGDNGANILAFNRFFTDFGGLPGSHMFGGVGATGEFTALDPSGFVIVPGEGIVAPKQNGTWSLIYVAEQTLWADGCNKDRKIGLLSQWGLSDEQTSPVRWSGNVGFQGQGISRTRPHDTMGVGYFYTGLSQEFTNLLGPVRDLHDVNGVELYYTAAVAKMLQVTTDLQIIEPADIRNDTAVVFGLRATMGI